MISHAASRVVILLGLAIGLTTGVLRAESAGGLTWNAPSGWETKPARPMRAATYVVPAAPGDSEDGECAVFYFGPGQGGSVRANIKRWLGQFRAPHGGSVEDSAEIDETTINGIDVTTVDVTGTYMSKPFPMARQATPKPGYRMLAAIAEGPEGSVFFKLTAPKKTTDAAEEKFQKMLESLSKQ